MKAPLLACALFGLSVRAGGIERGTKLAEALALREEASFRKAFLDLGADEQSELIRILTTDMRGWAALTKLPSRAEFETATDERKLSLNGLRRWLTQASVPSDPFDHLRFVGLLHHPVELKLRYEKGACVRIPKPAPSFYAGLAEKWRAWLPKRFAPPVARAPALVSEADCNRELTVALVADPGDGSRLREETILRADVASFPAQLEGEAWTGFRRKVWEGVEILLASMGREEAALPQRLRVIELVGSIDERTFLHLRQTAILARAQLSSR